MKIGLVDADLMDGGTNFPNLALMKIAGFYMGQDDSIELIFLDYIQIYSFDKIFISKVFTKTKVPAWILREDFVEYGGTGFFADGGKNLPHEIEHFMPFYDLYKPYIDAQILKGMALKDFDNYLKYSIGFTSRGCFRKCEFCVNKKYDRAVKHSPVSEFLDEKRPYICLLDDNILALPEWDRVVGELNQTGKRFQFKQGLDLRLMTDKKAEVLTNVLYHKEFIFAFDDFDDKELIEKKLQIWKKYTNKSCKLYVLCAFKSQGVDDIRELFERMQILMKYNTLPYIMRYELYQKSEFRKLYIAIARWCNQPRFFKKKSFREFCLSDQSRHKTLRICSSLRAMSDFEQKHPQVAKKHFDLKFGDRQCI